RFFSLKTRSWLFQATILNYCPVFGVHFIASAEQTVGILQVNQAIGQKDDVTNKMQLLVE
ncbi:MAG: hypothetical protein ABL919_15515, partial [Methylococcales bacterium]